MPGGRLGSGIRVVPNVSFMRDNGRAGRLEGGVSVVPMPGCREPRTRRERCSSSSDHCGPSHGPFWRAWPGPRRRAKGEPLRLRSAIGAGVTPGITALTGGKYKTRRLTPPGQAPPLLLFMEGSGPYPARSWR